MSIMMFRLARALATGAVSCAAPARGRPGPVVRLAGRGVAAVASGPSRRRRLGPAALISLGAACSAWAQAPTPELLLREGDTVAGQPVAGIRGSAAAGPGAFAAMLTLGLPGDPDQVDAVWGTTDAATAPAVLLEEGEPVLSMRQVTFLDRFGFAPGGGVAVAAMLDNGACSPLRPDVSTPAARRSVSHLGSVWAGPNLLAYQSQPGTMGGRFWRHVGDPSVGTTARTYWRGGAADLPSGPVVQRGLFARDAGAGLPEQLIGTGDLLTSGPTTMNPIQGVGAYGVSAGGSFEIAVADTTNVPPPPGLTTEGSDEIIVLCQWYEGDRYIDPVSVGGFVREGRSAAAAAGETPAERWRAFHAVGVAERPRTDPLAPPELAHWWLHAHTTAPADRDEVVVLAVAGAPPLVYREGSTVSGETLAGPLEHVAVNARGDVAMVWHVQGGAKEALVFRNRVLLKQGDQVPVPTASQPARTGALTNFLGLNTISVGESDAAGQVAVYVVANVDAGTLEPGEEVNEDGRLQCLYRVLADVGVSGCAADFNADGLLDVPDIFAFLSAWFAEGPGSDFNDSGVIDVADIFSFLSAWFAGC